MNTNVEPVTDEDVLEFSREFAKRCTLRLAIEQDRRRVAERQWSALRSLRRLYDALCDGYEVHRLEVERLRAESALSTDAGKGWIDATGAVEAHVSAVHIGIPYGKVERTVPADWAGSRVLIVRVAK